MESSSEGSSRRRTRLPQLLHRVIEQRRRSDASEAQTARGPASAEERSDHAQRIAALEQRLGSLESLVEGLQDSVHRSTTRLEAMLEDLDRKSDPLEIRRALDRDARERGV
jgi:hypothetical protein